MKIKNRRAYMPMILIEIYLISSLLLYFFGPLRWKTENTSLFIFFIIAYHVAFIIGYTVIVKINKNNSYENSSNQIEKFILKYFGVFIIICVICSLINYKNLTGSKSYIPWDIVDSTIKGLMNPGAQYYSKFDGDGGNKLITVIFAMFSFIYTSMIPIFVFLWKKINKEYKYIFALLIIFNIATNISIGTNKGVFDTMFMFVGCFLIELLLYKGSLHKVITKNKIYIILSIVLILCSSFYFVVNIRSRVGNDIPGYINNDSESKKQVSFVDEPENGKDNTLLNDAELFFRDALYIGSSYWCQGYYGMSLSVGKEFTTTYGIGNSAFLRSNFKDILGIDVTNRTYQHKITNKWDENASWHSFYSYFANDISFYGVILLMFILGMLLAFVFKDALAGNLIAKLLLPLFLILFIYMPANNQLFTQMQTFCAFYELICIWLFTKIRAKKQNEEIGSL